MNYEEFRRVFLEPAKAVAQPGADGENLCRRFYEKLTPEDLKHERRVHLRFLEHLHSLAATLNESPEYYFLTKVWGEDATAEVLDVVSWVELQQILTPSLVKMDLLLRVVGAFGIMDMPWGPVAAFIGDSLARTRKVTLHSEVAPALERFRNDLLDHLPQSQVRLDPGNSWLRSLIQASGNWEVDHKSWEKIDRLLQKPFDRRSKNRGPGWCRDQWQACAEKLRRCHTLRQFVVKAAEGDTNE